MSVAQEPKKPNKLKLTLALGCIGLVLLACVGSIGLFAIAKTAVGKLQPAHVACLGQPVPGATPGATFPKAITAFQWSGTTWNFSSEPPTDFPDVEVASEAKIVFCFEEMQKATIQTCPYDGGAVLNRVQQSRQVRAVDAATGQTLRATTITGSTPDACPSSLSGVEVYGVDVSSNEREAKGSAPGARETLTAFGDLVLGTAAPAPVVAPSGK